MLQTTDTWFINKVSLCKIKRCGRARTQTAKSQSAEPLKPLFSSYVNVLKRTYIGWSVNRITGWSSRKKLWTTFRVSPVRSITVYQNTNSGSLYCTHRLGIGRQALGWTRSRSCTRIGVAWNELLGGNATGEELHPIPSIEGVE